LRYGESNLDPAKVEQLQNYFRNESPEADEAVRRQVFKDTLGIDYPEMEKRLAEYAQKGTFYCYKAKLPQITDMKTYERRAMSKDEIGLRLAELSLRVNQSANARLRLLEAAGKNPANARYWEVLGSDAWISGDADVAQERWQRALEAGSDNPAVFHELGQMEGRRWFANFDYNFRLPDGRAQQLRTLLQRSITCAPEQNDAYEMLAWVEASVSKPEIANIALVEQRGKTQWPKPRTVLALALVRVRMNERESAIKLLDQLDKMNPEYWVASAAETVRAKLEDRAPRSISPPPMALPKIQRLRPDLPELP
jgi:tetratricopeptide (TPR) repeat protein